MASKLILTIFVLISILIYCIQASFTEVPREFSKLFPYFHNRILVLAPPKRPERFNSREELKKYLQKVF